MKKFFIALTTMLLGVSFGVINAQNNLYLNIESFQNLESYHYCISEYDNFVFQKENGCSNQAHWEAFKLSNGQFISQSYDELILSSDLLMDLWNTEAYNGWSGLEIAIHYTAQNCNITDVWFYIMFHYLDPAMQNPFAQDYVWKRTSTATILSIDYTVDCQVLWSTGSHQTSITVNQPGTYWVRIYNDCGEISDTIRVRNNVEIYRATTDLNTNLNKITWRVTDAQAEYVSEVKIYRNNQHVGTAPYTDGFFTDDIGSDATNWQYHVVAVSVEGQNCPIKSYWKRTIHLDHVQGTQGNHILQWTPYEQEQSPNPVSAYNIYDVVDGEPRLVMQVGNFTNVYSYNPADFEGYGTVAAVFGSKGIEDMAFSNMTAEVLDVEEVEQMNVKIYPNPAKDRFTIEANGLATITNMLGQVIQEVKVDGLQTIELPHGVYIVKILSQNHGTSIKKVIVE